MEAFPGVTAIKVTTGAVTVTLVEPLMPPLVAVTVDAPAVTPFAMPPDEIVAMPTAVEVHVTVPVRFCVVPFEYVPVAVNCCVRPATIDGLPGVTAIETSAADETVNWAEPVMLPRVAPIVVVPTATPVANPAEVIVATPGAGELHVTRVVRF